MEDIKRLSKLKQFLSWYRPYKGLLAADMICSALTAALALALPLCVRHITQDILGMARPDAVPALLKTGALMLGVILAQTASGYFYDYKGHDMGAKIERDMRQALFSHIQKFSFSFFDTRRTGDLMSRLTNDLNGLAELYHHGPENLVIYGAEFIGALVLLFHVNVRLTLAVCAVLPFMAVYSFIFYRRLQTAYKQNRAHMAEVNARAEEHLNGIRVVKSFANEPLEAKKFAAENNRFYQSRASIYKHEALHFTVMEKGLAPLITVAVVVLGGLWMGEGLTTADLLMFILCASYLTGPIPQLAFMVQQYQEGLSGYRRFRALMDTAPDIMEREDAVELPPVQGRVTFERVTFQYDKGQSGDVSSDELPSKNYRSPSDDVFRDIDLSVEAGERIAVVGRSGVGKTTLCALIPRFYEVITGAVRIDGCDTRSVTLASLRSQIGVVQQEHFLFAGTVMDNILYGKPGAAPFEAEEAAKKAGAHTFIMELPQGYDTDIGPRGVKLSGGQKQRLCIARVFLKNPPILIFDEATSNLDYESERVVMESLRTLAKGRTAFIIAHRLSTVRWADRIVVLTGDGIAEQGTHEALLAQNGEYAKLYRLQEE